MHTADEHVPSSSLMCISWTHNSSISQSLQSVIRVFWGSACSPIIHLSSYARIWKMLIQLNTLNKVESSEYSNGFTHALREGNACIMHELKWTDIVESNILSLHNLDHFTSSLHVLQNACECIGDGGKCMIWQFLCLSRSLAVGEVRPCVSRHVMHC